ncbi:hypothetical protein BKP42_68300 [Rhodococcus erythropolis]|nr:hypothetical protein BKP42_68300 [Rhodococcus erythropolis]
MIGRPDEPHQIETTPQSAPAVPPAVYSTGGTLGPGDTERDDPPVNRILHPTYPHRQRQKHTKPTPPQQHRAFH